MRRFKSESARKQLSFFELGIRYPFSTKQYSKCKFGNLATKSVNAKLRVTIKASKYSVRIPMAGVAYLFFLPPETVIFRLKRFKQANKSFPVARHGENISL